MDEKTKEILEWGKHCDLDQCEKAYQLGEMSISWIDYTYDWFNKLPEDEQMEHLDNAWDTDGYYSDFYIWWEGLAPAKREAIYGAIVN